MTLTVILEPGPPNWGSAASEGIGGVVAVTAPTRSAVIRVFRSALQSHLDYLRDAGKPVPVVENLEFREVVPA